MTPAADLPGRSSSRIRERGRGLLPQRPGQPRLGPHGARLPALPEDRDERRRPTSASSSWPPSSTTSAARRKTRRAAGLPRPERRRAGRSRSSAGMAATPGRSASRRPLHPDPPLPEGRPSPRSLEARVLFDADKLDSIGAVGVGRAFLFAGEIGARLHDKAIDVAQDQALHAGRHRLSGVPGQAPPGQGPDFDARGEAHRRRTAPVHGRVLRPPEQGDGRGSL